MPMRNGTTVLLVLPWSPNLPGGVSVVVRNLVIQFESKGVRSLVAINSWNAYFASADGEGYLNFRFALHGELNPLQIVKSFLTAPFRIGKTLRLLQEHKVDAVNFHYPSLDALGVALLKYFGLFHGRLILSFHGTDVRRPSGFLDRFLWKFILEVSDGVTACSRALSSEISSTLLAKFEKTTIAYNGVDTVLFSPTLSAAGITATTLPSRYIVSVGSFIPRKGHASLLEAFSACAQDFSDLHLIIVGMDGSERSSLVEQALGLGLGNRLTCLVGLAPASVASVVANAELCVQPSLAEPFGLAVIEAGACGIPVLATSVGGHLELIDNGETGLLFPPGDSGRCAELLRYILNNKTESRAFAVAFRSKVLKSYSWESCAQRYLSLLD